MQTIHIIPSQHHLAFKEYLLENTDHLSKTQVLDFSIAFSLQGNQYQEKIEAYNILKNLNLPALEEVMKYPKTSETVLNMIKDMNLLSLSIDDLPEESLVDKAIKLSIIALSSIVSQPKLQDNVRYIAYDHFLTYSQKIFCINNNIEIRSFDPVRNQNIQLKTALNVRQELEASIQDILLHKIENPVFVIPNISNHIPLIETSFKRYGISLSLEDRSFTLVKTHFLTLMDYLYLPNQKSLLQVLEANSLSLKYYKELIFLINKYSLPLPTHSHDVEFQRLLTLVEEEYAYLTSLAGDEETHDLNSIAMKSYALLNEHKRYNLSSLKKFLEENLFLYTLDDVDLLKDAISNLPLPKISHPQFKFYDLNDFSIQNEENVYALMMTAQNYPAVSANSGIFDESYLKRVKGYPALDRRTQHELESKRTFLEKSKNLTLSYPISDYEGKPQELSFAISEYANTEAQYWQLVEKENRLRHTRQLSSDIAKKLYTREGIIHTSVSGLQLFMSDPYQYFIERGLKLRKPDYPYFSPMVLGNINHSIMESYHKGLALNEYLWSDYQDTYEKMVAHRNDRLMKINLRLIEEASKETSFETNHSELRFVSYPFFKNFSLTGIIDRVDFSNNQLGIVDYKSSQQRLQAAEFKRGNQLQLVSYGIIASQIFKKELVMTYNYGFTKSSFSIPSYKYSSAAGVVALDYNLEEEFISKNNYKGWIYSTEQENETDIASLFHSALYFSGIKELKSGISVSPKAMNYKTIYSVLEIIYDSIYKNITNGVLDTKNLILEDLEDIKLTEGL